MAGHSNVLGPPLGGGEQAFLEENAKKQFPRFTQADKLRRRERPGGVLHPSMPLLGKETHLEVLNLMEAKARGHLGAWNAARHRVTDILTDVCVATVREKSEH